MNEKRLKALKALVISRKLKRVEEVIEVKEKELEKLYEEKFECLVHLTDYAYNRT